MAFLLNHTHLLEWRSHTTLVDMPQYLQYARGLELENRMPLFVKINHKLTVNDTMWLMRNHYEGTGLDPRHDVGAQAWHLPNRLGEDLSWSSGNKVYMKPGEL